MNYDWRQGSYIYKIYKLKKISLKIILKRKIITYFNILNNIEYLEMVSYLLEHSYKYRYYLTKQAQHDVLKKIKLIDPESNYLKYDSEYESEAYTDDSEPYTESENESEYSDSESSLQEFSQ